jgi:hypothetical protein
LELCTVASPVISSLVSGFQPLHVTLLIAVERGDRPALQIGLLDADRGVDAPHVAAHAGRAGAQELEIGLVVLVDVLVGDRGLVLPVERQPGVADDLVEDLLIGLVGERDRLALAQQAMELVHRPDRDDRLVAALVDRLEPDDLALEDRLLVVADLDLDRRADLLRRVDVALVGQHDRGHVGLEHVAIDDVRLEVRVARLGAVDQDVDVR